jgi:hypothetical protein
VGSWVSGSLFSYPDCASVPVFFNLPRLNVELPPYRTEGDNNTELINEFVDSLENKVGLVVFVDERVEGEPRRKPQFIPLRTIKIRGKPDFGGGMIHVEFELGKYVSYAADNSIENYDKAIRESLAAHPRMNIRECAYISIGPPYNGRIMIQKDKEKNDDAWQSIIYQLGRLKTLREQMFNRENKFFPSMYDPFESTIFIRITNLHDITSKKRIEPQVIYDGMTGYIVKSGCNYRLNMLFSHPRRTSSEIRRTYHQAIFSSSIINGIGKTRIPLNFRYDRRAINFSINRVYRDTWASISLEGKQAKTETTTMEIKGVRLPNLHILVKIQKARWLTYFLPVIFAFSTLLSSMHQQLAELVVSVIPALTSYQSEIGIFCGFVGTGISTYLLFTLYHKLT